MVYTKLKPRHSSDANVEEISYNDLHKGYRLNIPAGTANKYRLAQLDDYTQVSRIAFPLRPPLKLSLSSRASNHSIPGTWGFGLWNDPFGLSLGFGGNPFRLPALPNTVWFFHASKESYLSFRSELRPSTVLRSAQGAASTSDFAAKASKSSAQPGIAANGFLAQVFCSPAFHPLLIPAGLALPFSRKLTRRLLGKVIDEEGTRLDLDATQWHDYRLEWRADRVSFEIDGTPVLESTISPRPPLGLVIWIDNQYAAFTPDGKIGFGVLEHPEPAWIEVNDIDVHM